MNYARVQVGAELPDLDQPIPFTITPKGHAMNPNEDYYAAERRRADEAKQRRAIEEAEYEAEESRRRATRAANDAREAKRQAAAERSDYEATLDDLRDELDHVETDKARLIEALTVATNLGASMIETVRLLLSRMKDSGQRAMIEITLMETEKTFAEMRATWCD